jgi:hypothetical protein
MPACREFGATTCLPCARGDAQGSSQRALARGLCVSLPGRLPARHRTVPAGQASGLAPASPQSANSSMTQDTSAVAGHVAAQVLRLRPHPPADPRTDTGLQRTAGRDRVPHARPPVAVRPWCTRAGPSPRSWSPTRFRWFRPQGASNTSTYVTRPARDAATAGSTCRSTSARFPSPWWRRNWRLAVSRHVRAEVWKISDKPSDNRPG